MGGEMARLVHRQICAVLLCMLFMSPVCAAPDAAPRFGLSIRAGLALDEALQELARQTGVQVVFFSQITAGRSSPALSGEYTLAAAMARLLEGTDLSFREVNDNTIEVRQAPARSARSPPSLSPSPASVEPMPEVLVVGKAEQLVATRIPTQLREIPQSISVISHEQIRQQNSFELGNVMEHTPGIAVRRTNSVSEAVYSRAFSVTSYHADGGGALTPSVGGLNIYDGNPDMSEFDRVEVLRGSDALFSGNSAPGGTVSLVRKRPLSTPSFGMSATSGSWNNYRLELDATGPLTDEGALRARADVVYATRDYFFDRAHQDRKRIFAVVEYDLTPTSTLTAGGSYKWDDALPLATSATIKSDFSDAHLPRSTGLTFDWAFYNTRIGQAYLQYQQQFDDDWILKVNTSAGRTTVDYGYGQFRETLGKDSQSLGLPIGFFSTRPDHFNMVSLDATLSGKLNWFGLRETVAIGGDFTRLRGRLAPEGYFGFGPPLMNVRTFDPQAYPDPRGTRAPDLAANQREVLEQYGGFLWLQVDVSDTWSLSGGARVASDTLRSDGSVSIGGVHLLDLSLESGSSAVVQPYGALMYRINDHFSWYASYADVYRTAALPYVRPDGRPVGPEHGTTFESGVKGVWREGTLNGSLALYRVEQRHVAVRTGESPSSVYCCYGTGNGRSQGVDLEVDGELAPGWLIGSGYTYNMYEQADSKFPVTSTPRHALKIWTSAKLPGEFSRWTVGGSLRAQAKARGSVAYTGMCAQPPCEAVLIRPYAVVDLRVGFELDRNWQMALSANNVFDKRYYLSQNSPSLGLWYGEPRNFMLRIDAKY